MVRQREHTAGESLIVRVVLQEDAGLQEMAGRVGVLRVGKTCSGRERRNHLLLRGEIEHKEL